jgi:FecR protein
MKLARWTAAAGSLFLAALLSLPAWGDTTTDRHTALPGTLNYIEGQATIGDQALNAKSVGSADVQNGQSLTTDHGKAEILLTPGVYFRLGDNSSATMVSNSITNTQVALNQGEAMLEVDEIYPQNNIVISQDGARTRVLKTGLYDFDNANHTIRVFDGKADIFNGDHKIVVKGGHELALNTTGKLKAQDFNKKRVANNDDLYRWSSLRSEYLSEANISTAQLYYGNGWLGPGWGPGWWGPGWWGAGWYWNPWFAGFTFMPWNGYLYSPFGWGFYSPYWAYRAPVVVGGLHHFDGSRPVAIGHGFHGNAVQAFNGGGHVGGFRGGNVGSFHAGGMGGFHGSGFGGFHGGGMGGHGR